MLEGLADRLYEVPVPAGNYSDLSTDGKRLYFIVTETALERKQSLRSVAIESPVLLPIAIDLFFDEIRSYALTQDKKKILIRRANDLFVFDAGKTAPPPADQAIRPKQRRRAGCSRARGLQSPGRVSPVPRVCAIR